MILHPKTGRPIDELRLGRQARRHDLRTLRLMAYLPLQLPSPPALFDATLGVPDWPMYANDRLGDCTCAAAAHMVEVWSLAAKGQVTEMTDVDVIDLYGRVNGGVDNGAVELDVLTEWRKNGLSGDRILAFAAVRPSDDVLVRTGAYLFDGLYIGLSLPLSAQAQVGALWDVSTGPAAQAGSWGGHAVSVVGYTQDWVEVVTWGTLQRMTWTFWHAYCDEAFVIIPGEDVVFAGKPDAAGFDLDHLRADLAGFQPVILPG